MEKSSLAERAPARTTRAAVWQFSISCGLIAFSNLLMGTNTLLRSRYRFDVQEAEARVEELMREAERKTEEHGKRPIRTCPSTWSSLPPSGDEFEASVLAGRIAVEKRRRDRCLRLRPLGYVQIATGIVVLLSGWFVLARRPTKRLRGADNSSEATLGGT